MIARDFELRRAELFNSIAKSNAKIIVYGRRSLMRMRTIPCAHPPSTDLLFLTGYDLPGGALTIRQHSGNLSSTLFLPLPDPKRPLLTGLLMPFREAQRRSGVDSVLPDSELDGWIRRHAASPDSVYSSFPTHEEPHSRDFQSLAPYVEAMRVFKSPKEVALMKRSAAIALSAHTKLGRTLRAGDREFQVAARFNSYSAELGATGVPYPVVAASGRSALCVRYLDTGNTLKEGDSILIDAGAEFQHYASDFSRTWPIGNISKSHRAILELVEDAKRQLVQKVKAGECGSLNELNRQCQSILQKGLRAFGLDLDARELRKIHAHPVSHWIGLDVHDCWSVPFGTPLRKGCAFSVEPGLYFQLDNPIVPKELKGLGCRFEDTVILE
jgi:Xaa-Pro aminopeptidase